LIRQWRGGIDRLQVVGPLSRCCIVCETVHRGKEKFYSESLAADDGDPEEKLLPLYHAGADIARKSGYYNAERIGQSLKIESSVKRVPTRIRKHRVRSCLSETCRRVNSARRLLAMNRGEEKRRWAPPPQTVMCEVIVLNNERDVQLR
jgi:hypothetical protein